MLCYELLDLREVFKDEEGMLLETLRWAVKDAVVSVDEGCHPELR